MKIHSLTFIVILALLLGAGTIIDAEGVTAPTAAPGPAPGPAPYAKPSPEECRLQRRLGINACTAVLYGNPPSPDCCERIRVTDIDCVCSVITPELAALIGDVSGFIGIIQGCGRTLPRNFKCGSITTP